MHEEAIFERSATVARPLIALTFRPKFQFVSFDIKAIEDVFRVCIA